MESWMISLGIGIVTYISIIVTLRNKVDAHQREIDESHKTIKALFARLDKHGDDLVRLNTKAELAITAKEVDEKYLSKELFRQFEKHIDGRFDGVEAGLKQILNLVQKD